MKNIIQLCMVTGMLICANTVLFAQGSLAMVVLETNSTEDQFCFYVNANAPGLTDIELLADLQLNGTTQDDITIECLNDDVCRAKICYERPAYGSNPVQTIIECNDANSLYIGGQCTVVIYPLAHREEEPIELNIIADCGFGTPCNLNNLNPADISHLTLGVPRDDGGFDYIAYAGLSGNIYWFNEYRELIHSGAWVDRPDEVAYVKFSHYQSSSDPVLSGFGNTYGDPGVSFRVSTYSDSAEPGASMSIGNYPNPFNGQTKIQFTLEKDSPVTLDVYNAMGKKVATVLNQTPKARGDNEIIFDAGSLTSGVYYYIIQAGDYRGTQRMNLVR